MPRRDYDDVSPWYITLSAFAALVAALAVMQRWPRVVGLGLIAVPVAPLAIWALCYATLDQAVVALAVVAVYALIVYRITREWF